MPKVLKHFGPYARHPPVAAFCALSERCYANFHATIGGRERSGETSREHLVARMMYVAETTSTAIRLNVTWALSLPGMSLVRDRYEQTVRFSWLARQPDTAELVKYVGSYYAKANKVFRNLSPEVRSELDRAGTKLEPWMTDAPTKEERTYLERWESLDLLSMARKRDALPPPADIDLAREKLADLYTPIYQQFSSVSHYDMYGVNMLGLYPAPEGQLVLAPDPWWPAVLCCYNTLFDLIQCHDAMVAFYKVDQNAVLNEMFKEWQELFRRIEFSRVEREDPSTE